MASVSDNLWAAFESQVESDPKRAALAMAQEEIKFEELHDLALRGQSLLDEFTVRCGDVVALQLRKGPATFALWLACLRRGAIYTFLDPKNPEARTKSALARLEPKLLIFEGETRKDVDRAWRLASVDGASLLDLPRSSAPPASTHGLSPAYVMFTSGSTGEPKGAVIPKQGVLSLMNWVRTKLWAPTEQRFSNLNPLHFDNSVFDLYGGLLNGATLVPIETATAPNPALWAKALRDRSASVIFAVPTLFQTLDQLGLLNPEQLPAAKIFVFGGEGFPIEALRGFQKRFAARARLVNVYGPTETSCICSSLDVDANALRRAGSGLVSLGRMHAGFEHAVIDDAGAPCGRGETGELWIGGSNVGLGYYNNPEETARRFRQDPLQSKFRSIWYRSGDLVREDDDGLLWFCGRADNQVKIRGHRIELEEIDFAVEAFTGIERAVAFVVERSDGAQIHVAYAGDRAIEAEALLAHCRTRLPSYMVPAAASRFETLPTNANGKVDRKAAARIVAAT